MADNNEGEENTARGNEWEVVSLTASTYAAAPGPEKVELKDKDENDEHREDKAETSRALFMSGHFVFPPSQHENLPLETDNSDIVDENVGKNVASENIVEEGDRSGGKVEENWTFKGLNVSEDFSGIQFFDEKGSRQSVSGKGFEESTTLQELDLIEKEQSIYSTDAFSSFHGETELGGSTTYDENLDIPEVNEPSGQGLDFPVDASHSPKLAKDAKYDGPGLPCEAWWKRKAASLYAHAKEANAFWSIFIAAAVMGLVILGQRWQQERWQVLQLKWQANLNNEVHSLASLFLLSPCKYTFYL